jgi:fused signal recognition particle receptor
MVFDWFRRSAADAQKAPGPVEGTAQELQETVAEPAAAPEPSSSTQGSEGDAVEAPADSAPAAPPPVGAVDESALEWARQAYARLKAQQQSQQAGSAAPEPAASPAVESSSAAASPSPAVEAISAGAPDPDQPVSTATVEVPVATPPPTVLPAPLTPAVSQAAPAAPTPSTVADAGSAIGPPPQVPEPDPERSAQPPLATTETPQAAPPSQAPQVTAASSAPPSVPAPGLSLLERAAAQRQQRLQELSAPAAAAPAPPAPAAVPAPAPPAPATPTPEAEETGEPTLGAFDDTFTWSAEVLAAQGRSVEEISIEEIDWLGRLRQGLEKTRRNFVSQLLENLGDDPLTPEVLDDLETTLLRADVGVQATDQVLDALRRRLNEEVVDPAEGLRFLKQQLRDLLEAPISASEAPLLVPQRGRLNVWLMVGVNGVGKTTTLGKLANLAVRSGYSCLIAAADTFRAAAVQQVQVWGERSGVPVVSNPSANADPAAVVYDAIGAARSRGTELVLVDTAGRLQTKHNLMEELSKVRRIVDKLAPEAVVESLLVLDASQGQNGLRQAMAFASAAGLTGVVITKLDGSARGGVALAVASEAGLPIRFIGAGEGIRDLRPFNSFEFVEALLAGSR